MAGESASGIPLELVARVTPLPADGGPVPGTLVHEAHAVGHAALLLADRGVLLAGDMLSDVLIPSSTLAAPGRWTPTTRRSTGWGRPPRPVEVGSPVMAPWPGVPRWRPAWPPTGPTSTRCGGRSRSTSASPGLALRPAPVERRAGATPDHLTAEQSAHRPSISTV